MPGLLRCESKSRIVIFVSEHNYDSFASILKRGQSMTNQATADVPPLLTWQNRHRSQRDGCHHPLRSLDAHPAEQDVADNLPVYFRNQREQYDALRSQPVDQVSLV